MDEKQHIKLRPEDVSTWHGRLALARRILVLNQDDTVCRDCIGSCVEILHGPVPGAVLN